jgi:hypothetical protein
MRIELVSLFVSILGTVGLLVTLGLILNQIKVQKSDLEHRIYQQVSDRYSELLWRAAEDQSLDAVWNLLSTREREWINAQQDMDNRWNIWSILNNGSEDCPFDLALEKRLYRYTRASIELCEQVYLAWTVNAVSERVWHKFHEVLRTWTSSRWFSEVFHENKSRLDAGFTLAVEEMLSPRASG